MTVTPLGLAVNSVTTTKIQNDTDNGLPASEIDPASARSVQILASTTNDPNSGLYSDEGNFVLNVDNLSIDTTEANYYFKQAFKFNFNVMTLANLPADNIALNDFFPLVGILTDTPYFLIAEEISLGVAEYKFVDTKPTPKEFKKILIASFFFIKAVGVNGEIDPLTYDYQPRLIRADDFLRSGLACEFRNGLDITPRAELKFDISAGTRYCEAINYKNDRGVPNVIDYIAQSPMKVATISPAEILVPPLPIASELIDPTQYTPASTLLTIPANNWGIHLIFKTRLGNHGIIRPQELYGANNPPISNDSLSYEPNLIGVPSDAIFLAAWAIKAEATDLSDSATAFRTDLPRVLSNLN